MSALTDIQWTDRTWNPVRGCSRVSEGCRECFAMKQAHRFSGKGMPYEGLTTIRNGKVDWTGTARLISGVLGEPLSWRKPQRVFVNSMSDLFHSSLANEEIAAVFGVMAVCPDLTFQVLTKRPQRALEWFSWVSSAGYATDTCLNGALRFANIDGKILKLISAIPSTRVTARPNWPLPNLWLGVSCENQQTADERIPLLLRCPAAVRFISAEPLLGPLDLKGWGDQSPTKPGPEWDDAKWETFPWEAWVPENLRKLIRDFWSSSYCRGPKSWLSDHVVQRVPRTGAVVTLARDSSGSWLETDKMAASGITGRYVHLWNNIGRVVTPDGAVYGTAGGHGSGWLCRWLYRDGQYHHKLNWCIVGSESGPGARPMELAWARSIVDQCVDAGVPVFTKQIANEHDRKGGDPQYWPNGNWPREFPVTNA